MDQNGATVTEEPTYSLNVDDTGTYTYLGEASPGSLSSVGRWRISRVTNSSGSIAYASGARFDQIWDNRASISYG